jgi:IS605 OrfB family transposase
MFKIIHGELWAINFDELDGLIIDFQSCVRFSYCKFLKTKMMPYSVQKLAKGIYNNLNSRQLADAVNEGQTYYLKVLSEIEGFCEKRQIIEQKIKTKISLKQKNKLKKRLGRIDKLISNYKLVFGGRKAWKDYKLGKITKAEWTDNRNKQIYCRGRASRQGNLNARIVGDRLRITIGFKKWVYYHLFIPQKFQERLQELLQSGRAYNVRLIRKDATHFYVKIDYQITAPEPTTKLGNGCIGVDTNPDRIALAEVSKDGNLVESKSLINNRLLYGSTHKRDYDIGCLVKQVINYAKEKNKGIVFENLFFKKEICLSGRKINRGRAPFVWRKFIELLERKCIEHGVEYIKVNPAFTSIIGKYKYRWMHKVTIHESAAYVIGRRGLGFNEKLSFYKQAKKRVKDFVLGTLAGKYQDKRIHSWVLWRKLNDNVEEAVLTGLRVSLADLKEFVGSIRNKSAKLSGEIFLQELVVGSEVKTLKVAEGLQLQ